MIKLICELLERGWRRVIDEWFGESNFLGYRSSLGTHCLLVVKLMRELCGKGWYRVINKWFRESDFLGGNRRKFSRHLCRNINWELVRV